MPAKPDHLLHGSRRDFRIERARMVMVPLTPITPIVKIDCNTHSLWHEAPNSVVQATSLITSIR